MPFHTRRRGRSQVRLGSIIQSFKQIFIDGPASRAAATNIESNFLIGVDNYTGPVANQQVPTGAVVKSIDLQIGMSNLVLVSANFVWTLQLLRSNQGAITPNSQGGDNQRNQVIYTRNVFVGQNQNYNPHVRIKIPPKFQRIREGDLWKIVSRADAVHASVIQVIYKFYR